MTPRSLGLVLLAAFALSSPACVRGIKIPRFSAPKPPSVPKFTMPKPSTPRPGGVPGPGGVPRPGVPGVGVPGGPLPGAAPRPLTPGTRFVILPVPARRASIPGAPGAGSGAAKEAAGHADEAAGALSLSDLRRINGQPRLPLPHEEAVLFRGHMAEVEEVGSLLAGKSLLPGAVEKLSKDTKVVYRAVVGVDHTAGELTSSWAAKAPDSAALSQSLRDVHAASPKLADSLRAGLEKKALREGHAALAEKLRDLKMEAGELAPAARPNLPLPVAPAGGESGQRESVCKGLAALGEDATKEAERLTTTLRAEATRAADFRYTMSHSSYHLSRVANQWRERNRDKDDLKRDFQRVPLDRSAVEGHLGRRMTPAERLLAAHMAGHPADVIANTLKTLD